MSALVSRINSAALHRVVLVDAREGVYCFGFESGGRAPEWDYLQDTWDIAKDFCLERWGVPLDSWDPTDEQPNSN